MVFGVPENQSHIDSVKLVNGGRSGEGGGRGEWRLANGKGIGE